MQNFPPKIPLSQNSEIHPWFVRLKKVPQIRRRGKTYILPRFSKCEPLFFDLTRPLPRPLLTFVIRHAPFWSHTHQSHAAYFCLHPPPPKTVSLPDIVARSFISVSAEAFTMSVWMIRPQSFAPKIIRIRCRLKNCLYHKLLDQFVWIEKWQFLLWNTNNNIKGLSL